MKKQLVIKETIYFLWTLISLSLCMVTLNYFSVFADNSYLLKILISIIVALFFGGYLAKIPLGKVTIVCLSYLVTTKFYSEKEKETNMNLLFKTSNLYYVMLVFTWITFGIFIWIWVVILSTNTTLIDVASVVDYMRVMSVSSYVVIVIAIGTLK